MINLICGHFGFNENDSPLIIYPNERISRIIKLVELKQDGRCFSCDQRITNDHTVVSSGKPRHYYHKDSAIKHHIIQHEILLIHTDSA